MTRATTRTIRRGFVFGLARQRGQAMVEYLVGTIVVVMVVGVAVNPTLFSATADVLNAVKDYFRAFAYAISVAAT